MPPAQEIVDKATEGLDDDLNKIDAIEDDKSVDTDENKNKDDVEGFTADDVEDLPPKPESKSPEVEEINASGLSPEAKYIVDNLPVIVARVKDGDTIKELQVKSWTQLPEDVTFASKRDELAFMNALTAQENRAISLQQKFQSAQASKNSENFERQENEAIRQDIANLQKAGDLPKFKVKAEDASFNDDPAAKDVQKILDYMTERNEQYLKEYQQGRPYRHIGFNEAFLMQQHEKSPDKQNQSREDSERKQAANKVGRQGLASGELKKPLVKPGTRIDDILNRYDAEEW